MSNIIQLQAPPRGQQKGAQNAALLHSFARHRRHAEDVFWLKENAELLNVLECTNAPLPVEALEVHRAFYDGLPEKLRFFPQYYRFLLSICLDIEDLGWPGEMGAALAQKVATQGLDLSELSDLQRAEAARLLARRNLPARSADAGLQDRLRGFAERAATFAVPNRKAAYELTHLVFYLSEYGRRDPQLGPGARRSLHFAGTLAFLEQNADLLAEICISLRFAGYIPPAPWKDWVRQRMTAARIETAPDGGADGYHEWLMGLWMCAVTGVEASIPAFKAGPVQFRCMPAANSPLREISTELLRLGWSRSDDWARMRPLISRALSDQGRSILSAAEVASDWFEEFFSYFARAAKGP